MIENLKRLHIKIKNMILNGNILSEQKISLDIQDIEKAKKIFECLGFNELVNSIILVYLALGIGVGVVGSCISMRKYLEV